LSMWRSFPLPWSATRWITMASSSTRVPSTMDFALSRHVRVR